MNAWLGLSVKAILSAHSGDEGNVVSDCFPQPSESGGGWGLEERRIAQQQARLE